MKKLVAYFSATGTTEKLAKKLAKVLEADLFEIKPLIPYTAEDLDWTNKNSRTTIETLNYNSRPKVAEKIKNINEYDTIYVGFPIWWYVAPTIINTFLEQYNLEGKTIIPFATSGGSGMGKTNERLEKSCQGAKLLNGKRFSDDVDVKDLKNWIKSF